MRVMLCTLVLNEIDWLEKLYVQHRNWPGLACWCFVESADRVYARWNPDMVSPDGLSVDGTTEWLEQLVMRDTRVLHIRHGFSDSHDPATGKRTARQRYLDVAHNVEPDYLVTLDADEMYTHAHQQGVNDLVAAETQHVSWILNRREIWSPPCYQDGKVPLFAYEVVGGFWGIPCCHWWRFVPGMTHAYCHNTPYTRDGVPMNQVLSDKRTKDGRAAQPGTPEMIHMGFASSLKTRQAKNLYYARRGEQADPRRSWYVDSRLAWETWKPGDRLPRDAKVIPYTGPVPEIFQ